MVTDAVCFDAYILWLNQFKHLLETFFFWNGSLLTVLWKKKWPKDFAVYTKSYPGQEYTYVILVAITGVNELVGTHLIKSWQPIWSSNTDTYHLRVSDLQISCSDLKRMIEIMVPVINEL